MWDPDDTIMNSRLRTLARCSTILADYEAAPAGAVGPTGRNAAGRWAAWTGTWRFISLTTSGRAEDCVILPMQASYRLDTTVQGTPLVGALLGLGLRQ